MKAQLMEDIIVESDADGVSCNGGENGHPKVWYSFDGAARITCGYCERSFVKGAA